MRHSKQISKKKHYRRSLNLYSMFESSSVYILDDLNSITLCQHHLNIDNNRIYNLLKVKPFAARFKTVKCTCSKSMCDSRYCECFATGLICSKDCSCLNCKNLDECRHAEQDRLIETEGVGCRC